MNRLITLVLCLLAVVIGPVSCAASRAADTVRLVGEIDHGRVAIVRELLDGPGGRSIRWLEITSHGGDARAGMELAGLVIERGLGVRVRGFCISACALFPFMAARVREVESGSLVLFHNSMELDQALNRLAGKGHGVDAYASVVEREQQILGQIGFKADLVKMGLVGLEPVCVLENAAFAVQDPRRYGYFFRFGGFIMPRADVEALTGVPIHGFWPSNVQEAEEAWKKIELSGKRINWITSAEVQTADSESIITDCGVLEKRASR